MRITSFTIFNQLTRSLQERMLEMYEYSERLSTGKKINKPSDDVFGMVKSMDYKVSINEIDQYRKNTSEAESYLGLTDTIMGSAADVLARARELAVEASTGTQTAENRAGIAVEIASLRDELLRLSQTQLGDKYIFSGYKTDTQPFDDVTFAYEGDANDINVFIARDSTLTVNITGEEAFSYGGESFFETLDNLYNVLTDSNSTEDTISAFITTIDNDIAQVANARAKVGARWSRLEDLKYYLDERDVTLQMLLSNTEDADIAGTISEIAKIEVALESLRASGSNVISQSLMDFLQ
ncbi:MAG: flagellar hook-associated protein FlgL [Nitrospirae bacterium]|nr:flagellar hook-associated protein FlgL [Nitrospirota bacterium]